MKDAEASTSKPTTKVNYHTSKAPPEMARRLKKHPLLPAMEKLTVKIESVMQFKTIDGSAFDITDILQDIAEIRVAPAEMNDEVDCFMQDMMATLVMQLKELEKVVEYTEQFADTYKHTIRKRVPVESLVGSGDSDDDLPTSPTSSVEEALNGFALPPSDLQSSQSMAVLQTAQGTISVPLRLSPNEAQKSAATPHFTTSSSLPQHDEMHRLRMFLFQAAMNPDLTSDDRRKMADDIGFDFEQMETWITQFRRHAVAQFQLRSRNSPPETPESSKNKENGK
ncbi:hypothetical protein PFISCL1PPCAC_28066 [Pristionchus fissidentatus]|uniref:MEIS N-terminal domain-containing protein n=1 Tax=Pristionchus fissidentatus TaxID=1538716 RepID=A0AAV5WY19_9BILA|nr:hypothetical protein PFISCL1PPCAC_28066 [Pristionchus fissidentatus]